jgi:cell division protein ZapA (FtsZ GTPase activity inhibitor)
MPRRCAGWTPCLTESTHCYRVKLREPMKSIVVNVFGTEYNVKADSGGEHIVEVAGIVDRKMREISEQFQQPSATKTAVLACMNIVDEHAQQRRRDAELVARRIGSLIDKLATVVGTG